MKRLALVTGSSAGLGFAAASALAARGCDLVLVARTPDRLRDARERILSAHDAIAVETLTRDLTRPDEVANMIAEQTASAIPDIVVHVAGGPRLFAPGSEDVDEFQAHLQSHSMSLLSLMQAFAPVMQTRAFGRFIAVMSRALAEPRVDNPLSAAVRAPAWALMKSWSKSRDFSNVTFNALLPGLFNTDRFREVCQDLARQSGEDVELVRQRFLSAVPAGRLGNPEELGSLCAFLASDQGGYINGQRITIDGGSTASI